MEEIDIFAKVASDIAEWQAYEKETREYRKPSTNGPIPLTPKCRTDAITFRSCYECCRPTTAYGRHARCPKCQIKATINRKPFDPQKGDTVYVQPIAIPERWSHCTHSKWLVVSREDENVEIQIVGIPESRFTTTVWQLGDDDLTPMRNGGY